MAKAVGPIKRLKLKRAFKAKWAECLESAWKQPRGKFDSRSASLYQCRAAYLWRIDNRYRVKGLGSGGRSPGYMLGRRST